MMGAMDWQKQIMHQGVLVLEVATVQVTMVVEE
jgi:hypothetical protein